MDEDGSGSESEAPASGQDDAEANLSADEIAGEQEPLPDEVETGEHDLRKLAQAEARERRTTIVGELSVLRQNAGKVVLALEGTRTTLGRDPSCDIVIDDPQVSRRHAIIVRTDAGYFELRDAQSKAGVVHRGHGVERLTLLDGDRFQIGSAKFIIHVSYEEMEE